MAENVNMDSFIRDTLASLRRPRDVDFYSEQQPLVSTSTKKFTTTSVTNTPISVGTAGDLLSRSFEPPPLFITLNSVAGTPTTYRVYAQFGHVVPRHNAADQLGVPIEIDSLPTEELPFIVTSGDKLYVVLTIDVYGVCINASFGKEQNWPEDDPPQLIGGDDQYGTAGERYIRIAQIIPDPDSKTSPPVLICEQLHTGHIDYAQPTLLENCGTSGAGTLKGWSDTYGRWELRSIVVEGSLGMTVVGCNIIITDCCS